MLTYYGLGDYAYFIVIIKNNEASDKVCAISWYHIILVYKYFSTCDCDKCFVLYYPHSCCQSSCGKSRGSELFSIT